MNILMSAVSSSQESRFHNGTGHILDLAVSNSILDLFAMSLSKIPQYKMKDNVVAQNLHQQKQLTPDSRSLHINLHIYLIRRIYVVAQASLATDPSHTARVAAG